MSCKEASALQVKRLDTPMAVDFGATAVFLKMALRKQSGVGLIFLGHHNLIVEMWWASQRCSVLLRRDPLPSVNQDLGENFISITKHLFKKRTNKAMQRVMA